MNPDQIQLKVPSLNIWNHQNEAIRDILLYLANPDGKAYLVKMPTGTDKTRLFACFIRIAIPDVNYMIITPSTALGQQIIREVSNDFWLKIGFKILGFKAKEVVNLLLCNAADVLNQINSETFIGGSTTQSLQSIAKNTPTLFVNIKRSGLNTLYLDGINGNLSLKKNTL